MTELEKMQRAKTYMDNLANGIDPISGEVMEDDAVLNNVRMSRCFFYVSDILRQVIENGGAVKKQSVKQAALPPFSLSPELREKIEITQMTAMISHFAERVNGLADLTVMKKLPATAFSNWLMEKGYLVEEIVNNKKRKKPTKLGVEIGIESEVREWQYGGYTAILYTERAQRFLVENLDEIINSVT